MKKNFKSKNDDEKGCPKGRQPKYSTKRSGKQIPKDNEVRELGTSNDFNWYNLNKELVEMAGRVPFGRPIGNDITFSVLEYNQGTVAKIDKSMAIPGLATFYMHSSIGCNVDGAQTIDVAAKSIYSWVRHANSGHANYDSPDLMLYLLSCKEVYAAAGYMLKILGCINKYDPANRYLPDAVLASLGVLPWIRDNIANFRYFCAQWFKKAQVLYTPKKFPLFEKAFWMFTQLFAEDKTGKGQLYQYAPSGFFKYNPTKYTNGGCLEFESIRSGFGTFNAFTTYFTDMLDRLINDEDMGIMSGDIKKAFDNDVWSLGEFPFEGDLQIVYDSFVLQQMHNITPFMVTDSVFTDDIVQGVNNELLYYPRLNRSSINNSSRDFTVYDRDQVFIDIDAEVPTTEDVIEATQYSNRIRTTGSTRITQYYNIINVTIISDDIYLVNTGDYFCEEFTVTQMFNGSRVDAIYTMGYYQEVGNMTSTLVYQLCCGLSAFEWLPKIIIDANISILPFWQMHNYTLVRPDVIANLHDATWLSLLAIPANQHLR